MIHIVGFVLGFIGTLHAQDLNTVWQGSGVDRALLDRFSQVDFPCEASPKNWLACLQMMNGLNEDRSPARVFLPATIKSIYPTMQMKVLARYGQVVLAEVQTWADEPPSSPRETAELELAFAQGLRAAAFASFETQHARLDFPAAITEALKDAPSGLTPERRLAKGINHLLAVHDGHGRLDTLANVQNAYGTNGRATNYGIGVIIEPVEGKFTVLELIPESPADRAGVRVGDVVTSIDGTSLVGRTQEQVIELLRGPAGETVLELRRGGRPLPEPLHVTRGPSRLSNPQVRLVNDFGVSIAVLRVRTYLDEDLSTKMAQSIRALPPETKGLILDLRNVTGGDEEQGRKVAELFLGKKIIYRTRGVRNGVTLDNEQVHYGRSDAITDLPMTVLINGRSASAAEITAGALQDHGRALLVGERSYGKGSIQSMTSVKGYSLLVQFETQRRFYQPRGRTNQIYGLRADLTVYRRPQPTADERFTAREETETPSALPPEGEPLPSPLAPYVAELRAKCLNENAAVNLYWQRVREEGAADLQLFTAEDALRCEARVPLVTPPPPVEDAQSNQAEAMRVYIEAANARVPQPMDELRRWLEKDGLTFPTDFILPKLVFVDPNTMEHDCDETLCTMRVHGGQIEVSLRQEAKAMSSDRVFLSEVLMHLVRAVQMHQLGPKARCSEWRMKNNQAVWTRGRYLRAFFGNNMPMIRSEPPPLPLCQP